MSSWEGSACYPRSTFYPLSDGPSPVWFLTRDYRGHRLVGSLTGVVASKSVTEASKGALGPIGNRPILHIG